MKKFFKKNWFSISTILILFFSALLRFYNYSNRWVLAGDQAHFAIAGRFMLEKGLLPLLGPFSSAGPFQTGGEWYWFVALGSLFNLWGVMSPWVFLTVTYVFFVFLMILIGRKIENKIFGIIVGVLAAVSTGQIIQSVNLSNQSPIPIFSALAILSIVYYLQTKKIRYLFYMSLSIGIASSIHLQGVALAVLIFATLIFGGFPGIQGLLVIFLGVLLPWIPVFAADSQNQFTNIKNMIYYFFFEKNKVPFEVLGRRWKTFILDFIPHAWAYIIGGLKQMGYVTSVLVLGLGIYTIITKKIKKEWIILFVSTIGMFIVIRYTRTPLFESFYVFIHPFIILLTGFVILQIYNFKKILGVLFFALLIFTSMFKNIAEITREKSNPNTTVPAVQMNQLVKKIPNTKFAIFDYDYKTSAQSLSLVLFLYNANKITDLGTRIGYSNKDNLKYPILMKSNGFTFYNLSKFSNRKLEKEKWVFVNPSGVYHSVQDWYKK